MNIYFSGIGGVGIGPLAEIAHDAGYDVSGSDPLESLMTAQLKAKGIQITSNQDGQFLKSQFSQAPINLLVHTAALPDNHPELVVARQLGIKTVKRDELLSFIIQNKGLKLIAVAGTHGKTTTTGMLIWTFKQLGLTISYSIGSTIKFGPSGKFDPKSHYFIYECDEFDRNFLHFHPHLSIVTALDYDHPDTYKSEDEYRAAFRQFATQSDHLITWNNQHPEIYEGLDNVDLVDVSRTNNLLRIAGEHNRRNASLVEMAMQKLGIKQPIGAILNDFPGTDRRFEKLAENLYTDYGHHPSEIAATLQMARELSEHVVLVYQPHQNIRQHELRDKYTDQFELAEKIYWLPTYLTREDKDLPILNPSDLIEKVTNKQVVIETDFKNELWQAIEAEREKGSLVLIMGAGTIDSWVRQQLAANA